MILQRNVRFSQSTSSYSIGQPEPVCARASDAIIDAEAIIDLNSYVLASFIKDANLINTGQILVNIAKSMKKNQSEVFFIFSLQFHTNTLKHF